VQSEDAKSSAVKKAAPEVVRSGASAFVVPVPQTPGRRRLHNFLDALDRMIRVAEGDRMCGIFWWEPIPERPIAKRAIR